MLFCCSVIYVCVFPLKITDLPQVLPMGNCLQRSLCLFYVCCNCLLNWQKQHFTLRRHFRARQMPNAEPQGCGQCVAKKKKISAEGCRKTNCTNWVVAQGCSNTGEKGKKISKCRYCAFLLSRLLSFFGWQAGAGGVWLGDLELLCVLPQHRGAMASQAPAK